MFHWLGAGLLKCGVAGPVLAAGGRNDSAIDLLAGVVPGAVLLGSSLRAAPPALGPQLQEVSREPGQRETYSIG